MVERSSGSGRATRAARPAAAAVKAALPAAQTVALCRTLATAPAGDDWLSEIKLDGYRLIVSIDKGRVRLLTRNGLDWTDRLPAVVAAFGGLRARTAMIDGELVALQKDGVSSFPALQAALKAGRDDRLVFEAFDLLHLDGWDLRPCRLLDRKAVLQRLSDWDGMLRFSAHVVGDAPAMHRHACGMALEGIVCKRADAPYHAGRGGDWVKVKCQGREEFIVLGWTPPKGGRTGLGSVHVGYYDPGGRLHYAGGVGSGFADADLMSVRRRLDGLAAEAPRMVAGGEAIDASIRWVRPELVVEVGFTGWSGAGRVRHGVFLGVREDKAAHGVVREMADPEAARSNVLMGRGARRSSPVAVPPVREKPVKSGKGVSIVTAKAPQKAKTVIGHVALTHADRALWPGITKQDLAAYWQTVAPFALPGLVRRPLSIMRCPDGVGGEHFFQKNGHGYLAPPIREGHAGGQPYLAIDDADGLFAMAQMSAVELHPWGSTEDDPLRPDHLVFDLDPGEGVAFPAVVAAALEVRERLQALKLVSFCRTSGGKGLHVVVPLTPEAAWDRVKPFCRAFAETMAQDAPDRFVAHVKIVDRTGKILVDWLRNGLGATAVASYCPRARPGAGVATPLAWREVTPKLDPAAFTVLTVPKRLARLKTDAWDGFGDVAQALPALTAAKAKPAAAKAKPAGGSRIVVAAKPKRRATGGSGG